MEVNKLSNEEIYNCLLKEIDKLYIKYRYLNITKQTIMEIVQNEVINSKNNYDKNDSYIIFIRRRVEARIKLLGTKLFNDPEQAYNIIDNYIKEKFSKINTYDLAYDALKELNNLFLKYNYIPEPNTIGTLIRKNMIFSNTIELIVNKHIKIIKSDKLEKLFNSNNIITIIGIYCMIKNIEINDLDLSNDDYYKEISNIPLISIEEMKELNIRIKNGDELAKKRFAEGNLKLVVNIAKRFYRLNNKIQILDLIQAGNIGLMKAVEKYDFDLGYQFSTYANWWIRTEIVREIQNNARTIRIPVSLYEKINAYKRIKEKMEQDSGMEISPEEVAKFMNISSEKATEYEKLLEELLSLNYSVNDEENFEMLELISDDSFIETMELRYLSSDVKKLLNECSLTEREMQVLALRYGSYDGVTRTLEEVGNIFGLKKETIRRNEAYALYKLRTFDGTKRFASYMDNPERALKILDKYHEVYTDNPRNRYKSNPIGDASFGYNTVKCK